MKHIWRHFRYYALGFLFGYIAMVVIVNAPTLAPQAAIIGAVLAYVSFNFGSLESQGHHGKRKDDEE